MDRLAGQRILVVGLGLSGRSAANYCAAAGASVVAVDERPIDGSLLAELAPEVEYRTSSAIPPRDDFDLVVPSPGVPPMRYREGAKRVWGDVELAARALEVPVVAVTGTNGKSTVTCLIEAALRGAGLRARAAGNVGEPALDLVGAPLDVAVLEVSSFQLECTESFRPRVAVILNITPDHLDRHGSFDAYVDAKARILANQGDDDVCVLDFECDATRALAARAAGRVIGLRSRAPLPEGAWLDGENAVLCAPGAAPVRVPLTLRLAGRHNRENALAALAAAWALGADPVRAAAGMLDFAGLPHRMEIVAESGGVTWVDDSKATNPAAAQRALDALEQPAIWIGGGRGKALDFSALADAAAKRARAAILIGESAAELETALAGRIPTEHAASIEEAVTRAAQAALRGDAVLLAPACASQDQFRDFAERGERFRAAVAAFEENRS